MKTPTWSERGLILASVLIVLGWIACATPCAGQNSTHLPTSDYLLIDCLDGDCGAIIKDLVVQSEADSLAIRELEIKLFWANERVEIANSLRPNWLERFIGKYGFAIGMGLGVWVGAEAVN